MLSAVKSANLALRFILELCALAAFGYWGFHTGKSPLAKIALGIGAPVLVAAIWVVFVAPGSARELHDPIRLVVELVIFGLAAIGLAAAGRPALAWVLGIVFVVNRILMYVWRQ